MAPAARQTWAQIAAAAQSAPQDIGPKPDEMAVAELPELGVTASQIQGEATPSPAEGHTTTKCDLGPTPVHRGSITASSCDDLSTTDDSETADNERPEAMTSSTTVSGAGIAKAMSAPPGIGPPGVWLWPDPQSKPHCGASDASEAASNTVSWPETSGDSPAVDFVGNSARLCFGTEFKKVTVSWAEPRVQGEQTLPVANVELHLEPTASIKFGPPLARLHLMLARDQALHQMRILRAECREDAESMRITCIRVSTKTCWDVLKSGACPRPNCTWEHPVPTLVNVSCAGCLAAPQLASATVVKSQTGAMKPEPVGDTISRTLLNKDAPVFAPSIESDMMTSKNVPAFTSSIQLNIGAYDFMSDSSDEM